MAKIAVVTDSTASIPEEIRAKYNIYVAPLTITWDRIVYKDNVDISPVEFYKKLRKEKNLPTTSGAIQGEFLKIFEDVQGKVDGIVVVALSAKLSAGYSSAMTAKEMVPGVTIEIVDSQFATTALGFIAIEAARIASAGGNLEEVANAARKIIPRIYCFIGLDTLEYLRRGGRAGIPQAALASFLQVKPIMQFKDGLLKPYDRPRTRKKLMETLVGLLDKFATPAQLHIAVMHGDFQEGAEKLKKMILEKFQPVEMLTTEVSPVVGTHFGPNSLALAFYNE